jgi:predicted negative regulator of RcsB-dependent stress response
MNSISKMIKENTGFITVVLLITVIYIFTASLFSSNEQQDNLKSTFPLTYQEISTAINEHGELILLNKTNKGYEVFLALSDSVTLGIFNMSVSKIFYEFK